METRKLLTVVDLDTLDAANGLTLSIGAESSFVVAGGGDLNGDGWDDVAIGVPSASPNGANSGAVYVVFGTSSLLGTGGELSLNSLDGSDGFVIRGIDAEDQAGASLSISPDINGDGRADLVISAPNADPDDVNAIGETYVVFGAETFSASLELSSLDGTNGFAINGGTALIKSDGTGVAVGDIDGDGLGEVAVTSQGNLPSASTYAAGDGFVIFGSEAGFPAVINLGDLDGTDGFRVEEAGAAVASAGDLNGDGFGDLAFASSRSQQFPRGTDRAYVLFGSGAAYAASVALDGSNGFSITGNGLFSMFGRALPRALGDAIRGIGDVNGDDIDDLAIGTGVGANASGRPASFVLHGSDDDLPDEFDLSQLDESSGFDVLYDNQSGGFGSGGFASGGFAPVAALVDKVDFNGDGKADLLLANPVQLDQDRDGNAFVAYGTANGFGARVELGSVAENGGLQINGGMSTTSAVSAGDFNGDGIDDILIGGDDSPGAYILFGKPTLPIPTVDLDDLEPAVGATLKHGNENSFVVAGGGDLNGDGKDDVAIGVPSAETNGADSGAVYVLLGTDSAIGTDGVLSLPTLDGTTGFVINGIDANDRAGASISFSPDINGDGRADLIISAPNADPDDVNAIGETYVVFGAETFPAVLELSSLDGANGFAINGGAALIPSDGTAVSAGDIDGDGLAEVAITALGNHPTQNSYDAGDGFVVLGSDSSFPAVINLGDLDGTDGFRVDSAGAAVAAAGDINGDGLGDLVYASSRSQRFPTGTDRAYVLFGSDAGYSPAVQLDGSNGFSVIGNGLFSIFSQILSRALGDSIRGIGDVNGDDIDDLAIGTGIGANGNGRPASFVLHGDDDFPDEFDLSQLDDSSGFDILYDNQSGGFGSGGFASVSGGFAPVAALIASGDFNGDGKADLLLSNPIQQRDNTEGHVFVAYGNADGFGPRVTLREVDDEGGLRIDGSVPDVTAVSAGDFNGDGLDDILIGGNDSPGAYLVFGRATGRPAGFGVIESNDSTEVSETGSTDTFNLVLNAAPTSNVVLEISSTDTDEVTVSPATLTFTPANWSLPQTVTATGKNDAEIDGDQTVNVTVSVKDASSAASYASVPDQTIEVVNKSIFSQTSLVLNGRGRVSDYVDISGGSQFEIRTSAGAVLVRAPAPDEGGNRRVSFAGLPGGTYNLVSNSAATSYTVTPSAGFGTATGEPTIAALDLDGNGYYQYGTDGLLLLAWALGGRGAQLEALAAPNATRTGDEIAAVIEQLGDSLDIDGDGVFRFSNDGTVMLRRALGLDRSLWVSAASPQATRSAAEMASRIGGLTAADDASDPPASTGPAQIVIADGPSAVQPGSQVTIDLLYRTTSDSDGTGANTNDKARSIAVELFWDANQLDLNVGDSVVHQLTSSLAGLETPIGADPNDIDRDPITSHRAVLYWANTSASPTLPDIGDHTDGLNLASLRFDVGENLSETHFFARMIPDPANFPVTEDRFPAADVVFAQPAVSTKLVIRADETPPGVESIERADDNPTNADSVDFTVTFSEAVDGIGVGDFVVDTFGSSAVAGEVASVSASSGTTVVVTVNEVSGDGLLGLNFDADASGGVTDEAGNVSNADFGSNTDIAYTIDNTAPTAGIAAVSPDPRGVHAGVVTINLSEAVDGLGISDFSLSRSGETVSLEGLSLGGDGLAKTIDLSSVTAEPGNYVLTLKADGSEIRDAARNEFAADVTESWTKVGDRFEENNSVESATPIDGRGGAEGLSIHSDADVDYFTFVVSAESFGTSRDFIEIDFSHRDGDLNLVLKKQLPDDSLEVVRQSDSVTDDERVSLDGLLPARYFVQVLGDDGSTAEYDIEYRLPQPLDQNGDELEANNSAEDATVIEQSGVIRDLTIHNASDEDYFKLTIPTGSTGSSRNFVEISFSHDFGDLDLHLFDSEGARVSSSSGVSDTEKVGLQGLDAGDYFAQVVGLGDDLGIYDIEFRLPAPPTADRLETNNTAATATDITESQEIDGLSIHSTDDLDFFAISVPEGAVGTSENFVEIFFANSQGDLDLRLRDASENRLRSSSGLNDGERISLEGLQPGQYLVEVFGFEGGIADYEIEFDLPVPIAPEGDRLEPNNSTEEATEIRGRGEIGDLSIHNDSDKDVFAFVVAGGARGVAGDFARIDFSHQQGDLDLFLLNSAGTVIDSDTGVTNSEQLDLATLGQGTYYLQVAGFNGAVAEYTVSFRLPAVVEALPEDDFEPNNAATADSATEVRESGSISDLTIHSATDKDYFQINIPGDVRGDHYVKAEFTHSAGNLDLRLLNKTGRPIAASNGLTNVEQLSLRGLAAGMYFVEVTGVNSAVNRYDIEFNLPKEETIGPDSFEENNDRDNATELREAGRVRELTIHSDSDVDFFTFEVGQPRGGDFVAIDFSASVGDLDMLLLDSDGDVVTVSNGVSDREKIALDKLAAGAYFVQVVGFEGALGEYDLTLELHDAGEPDNLDRYEPNDDVDGATDLRRPIDERVEGLTIHTVESVSNPDFFEFELGLGASSRHFVFLEFAGDVDFELVRPDDTRVASQAAGDRSNVRQVPLAGESAGTYVLHVFGLGGTGTGSYALDFRTPSDRPVTADRLEPNNATGAPTELGGIEGRRVTSDLSIHAADTSDVDVFAFQLVQQAGDDHFVEIQFSADQGNLDLELLDAAGQRVAIAESTTHNERLSLEGLAAGSYFARVFAGTTDNTADYELVINGPHRRNGFQIEVNFTDNNLTDSQKAVFTDAANRWSQLIVGDVPDVRLSNGTIVDDLIIDVSAPEIDGPGNVLGQAGPTQFRQGTALPHRGIMEFDSADVQSMEAEGVFVDVILHEMGHVLGMGTLWNFLNLVTDHGGADPRFIGENAAEQYSTLVGSQQNSVPVANTGGQGTRDAHWRESVFTNEIMTGFLSGDSRPISAMTIGSLEDIGYSVDYEAADQFVLELGSSRTETPGSSSISTTLSSGDIEVVGILAEGGTGSDTIGDSDPDPAEFESSVVPSIEQLYPADNYEGRTVELRSNQTITGLTIQPGSRSEREDVFTFTLTGRGTFEDGITVTGGLPGQLLDLQLRAADNSTVLSNGLVGGQRLSLAGYNPGIYYISVNSDDPNDYSFTFDGQFTAGEPDIAAFDFDGDGEFQFQTDGIVLLAYALGSRGEGLEPFRAPGDDRTGAQIGATIELLADSVDVDGDGRFRFNNDGILLLAHSLGLSGDALEPFASPDALRNGSGLTTRLNGLVADARRPPQNRQQTPDDEASSTGYFIVQTETTPIVDEVLVPVLSDSGAPLSSSSDDVIRWQSPDDEIEETPSTVVLSDVIVSDRLGTRTQQSTTAQTDLALASSVSDELDEGDAADRSDDFFSAIQELGIALSDLR